MSGRERRADWRAWLCVDRHAPSHPRRAIRGSLRECGTARVRTSNVHTTYCALCRDTYNKPPLLPRQSFVPSSRMRRAAAAGQQLV